MQTLNLPASGSFRTDTFPPRLLDNATAPRTGLQQRTRLRRHMRGTKRPLETVLEAPAVFTPGSHGPAQSLTDQVLSSGTVEGDPRKALRICEAFWTVR